jgi:hypothetical protein
MATPSFGESLVQHTISGLLLRWLELHISRLRTSFWQLYAELSGQIQGCLEWSVQVVLGGPHVRDVAVEAAGEAVGVIVVEVHRWVFVVVIGGHATGLAGAVGGSYDQARARTSRACSEVVPESSRIVTCCSSAAFTLSSSPQGGSGTAPTTL